MSTQLGGLLTPLEFGGTTLPNRIAMAPMTRQFSPDGIPGADVAEYYRRRAAGGVGLIITEGTYIPHDAVGPSTRVPRLYGEEQLEGWRKVVEAVHAEGAAIIPQLWHLGVARGDSAQLNPEVESISPSGLNLAGEPLGRAVTDEDLDAIVEAYVAAAVNAKSVGFDGVELHGAHGYLLDQFLWERTNRRGTTLAERAQFPARVVQAVRASVGPQYPIVYRFSQWKAGNYDATIVESSTELQTLLEILKEAGVSVFHPSTRRYWDAAFPAEHPTRTLAGWTRTLTGLPAITVGSVGLDKIFMGGANAVAAGTTPLEPLIERFDAGEFDIAAVGRALISDPEWVNKRAAGHDDDIVAFDPAHQRTLV